VSYSRLLANDPSERQTAILISNESDTATLHQQVKEFKKRKSIRNKKSEPQRKGGPDSISTP